MENGLLFVSVNRLDAGLLRNMLGPVGVSLEHVPGLKHAKERLNRGDYTVVLTEAQLPDGTWTDMLDWINKLPNAPVLLVTDRLADHNLWAEVLNLGAYDLLAQPFDCGEVQRIVSNACLQKAPRKSAGMVQTRRVLAQGAY